MKRELCFSQIQTKKPNSTTTKKWYLTAPHDSYWLVKPQIL